MTPPSSLPESLLTQTRAVLRAHGLRPRRHRGQNFLVDSRVRDRIVAAAGVGLGSLAVEIGPGTGILSEAVLEAGADLLAVELDRELAGALSERLGGRPGFLVRVADALTFDFAEALRDDPRRGRIRLVANIPYYITTPLIFRLLGYRQLFDAAFLTVQREVADRLVAPPGGKTYGALTLACRYRADVRRLFVIPRTAFYPVPEVDSALVRLDLLEAPRVAVASPTRLFAVIRAGFGARRKTVRNALCRGGWSPETVGAALDAAGIDGRRRGETLTLDEFARVSDALPPEPTQAGGAERGVW